MSNDSPVLRLAALGLIFSWASASAAEPKSGWTEVKTAHVTVKTDLSLDGAREAALLAEQTRAAVLAAAWPGTRLTQDRIELIVFSNHQDFERYFGDLVLDKVVLGNYPPTVFLFGAPGRWERRSALESDSTTSVLRQALVQHLATFIYRRQPRWFAMGLAEFLETLRISEDGKTVTFGALNILAKLDYATHRTVGVADALAWGVTFNPTDEGNLAALNGLSWLMVYWMFNAQSAEFVRFQKLLITGLDPARAFKVVFPTLTPAALDQELNHFAQYGKTGVATLPLPEATYTVDHERPVSTAEVHAMRAEAALAGNLPKEAQAELSAALSDDPGNVAALRRQVPLVKPAERMALARRATAAHPDDGLAWLMLGDALREAGAPAEEAAQAYRKATELLPGHPSAFSALASLELQKGQAKDALPLAQTAVRMAPWDAGMLDTLAAALAGVGRCGEAVATDARAMDMASEGGGTAKRPEYAARLAEMQKTCTEAPATPSASEPAGPKP
jgi:tetratricopeptide (TPR) repeat protein